jgi:hypothetical protein
MQCLAAPLKYELPEVTPMNKAKHQLPSSRAGIAILAMVLTGVIGVTTAFADDTKFSGQATGAIVTLPLLQPIILSDTGPLDAQGGQKEMSLLSASVPDLLTAEVLHASTVGQGDRSRSEASLANLNVTIAGNTIGADFLMARATAVCDSNGSSSVSGSSQLASLVINGQTIEVSGQPNQEIDLPLGTGKVTINEQTGDSGSLTVNALHVIVNGVADVIIASAHADVKCGRPPCESAKDFVTGGGWIMRPGGAKATFAVAGGLKNGSDWGHLQYIDHDNGMKVKGTGVTAYMIVDETTRHIEGTCQINGVNGKYNVDVSDAGEPGRDDTFSISLSNGYTAAGKLGGGNIQIHNPCR